MSTTFFKLSIVSDDCSMSEFASNHNPSFAPEDGFGFYKGTHEEVKKIQLHRRVILMEEVEVIYNEC